MKIAVIGDLHYPALEEDYRFIEEDRNIFFESFLERFFSIPADLYISVGDLTNFGTDEELQEVYSLINRHQKPFIHVLGNHDVYALSRDEVLAATGQQRFHSVTTESAVLAFIDTAKEQDFDDWGGTLHQEQLEWLASLIKQSGDLPLLVFGHHPVYGTTTNSEKDKLCIPPSIPVWETLSQKQGTGLYVNGHNHFNSIAARDQWHFLQLAAVLDQQAVRIIDVSDAQIAIDSVDLYDPDLYKRSQVIGNAMNHFGLNPHQLGEEQDVRKLISLNTKAAAEKS